MKKIETLILLAVLISAINCLSTAQAVDSDGDGISDANDNCWGIVNPDQTDSDFDCPDRPFSTDPLCGNACDGYCQHKLFGDINCDCKVDMLDFAIMSRYWLTDCNIDPNDPACMSLGIDNDNDGWNSSVDCDDGDPDNYPGNTEVCDGQDNDCDGTVDEGCSLDVVVDGGFEGGTPSAAWTEYSTNFGTPICNVATCGTGGGTGPHSGTYWVWLGGVKDLYELGTVTQNMTIPVGTATLRFWLAIPSCDTGSGDIFEVKMDGVTVYSTNSADPSCDTTIYTLHVIDVSVYADGGTHSLQFRGETISVTYETNFMVDDVSLLVTP